MEEKEDETIVDPSSACADSLQDAGKQNILGRQSGRTPKLKLDIKI